METLRGIASGRIGPVFDNEALDRILADIDALEQEEA